MADIQYTQLDPQTRLQEVRNRIRLIETQYQQIQLRVEAPDINNPANPNDQQNMQTLTSSLETLHKMESDIEAEVSAPAAPAGK